MCPTFVNITPYEMLKTHLLYLNMAGLTDTVFILTLCLSEAHSVNHSSTFSKRFLLDENTVSITVNTASHVHRVSNKFLSVTLDSYQLSIHLKNLHANSTKVKNIARGLAPAYFRIGGTMADEIVFKNSHQNFHVMSEQEFDIMYTFAKAVNWSMIFDLNLMIRSNGQWNSSNAELLMRYAASKGHIVDLELGNEPNVFEHKYHKTVDPAQMGRDFAKLKQLMKTIHPFDKRILIGPSVTSGFHEAYAQKFLSTGSTAIDAFSLHHYYMAGSHLTQEKMLDPNVLNSVTDSINRAKDAIRKSSKGTHSLWLGETGIAYGQGRPANTFGFITSFTWLDKLGMAASHGVSIAIRQGFNNLYDHQLNPVPEYWVSLLHKRLVGEKVLHLSSNGHHNKLRIYAHCAAENSQKSGVTLFYLNMYSSETRLNVPAYSHQSYHVYSLTAGGNGELSASTIKLNGKELHMNGDSLPQLLPKSSNSWPIQVPGHSLGFLVIPNANAQTCK